ncbi:MAG: RNA-protein complex protein Nop10 [Methanosarcinaceae archaeon]|nr:RNA-protein complex protein Nop10 [Methanosarcinaceae archaeon]
MKGKILKCKSCNLYTLKIKCPKCGKKASSPKPMRYSPEDKWGKYRRIYFGSKNYERNDNC